MANYASKVVDIALAEVGYLEKRSKSNLDSKTANAGSANYTKYARDLDAITGFYNGKKNGYSWCDVFVDWCFVQAFGIDAALTLLCQSMGSAGAGCTQSSGYYQKKGRFFKTNPKVGDQIFFGISGDVYHTGLVYKVDASKVYTVEGNTSSASGVVANGGGVFKKSYSLTCSKIYGYGRPAYDETDEPAKETTQAAKDPDKIDTVEAVQSWLNSAYNSGLVVDGIYGAKTKKALVKVLQRAVGVDVDGIYGAKTNKAVKNLRRGSTGTAVKALQGLLVCNGFTDAYVDGDFGKGTERAVIAYQQHVGIDDDGIAGRDTFTKLCK